MSVETGKPALDLSAVPTDKFPLIHVLEHRPAGLCAYAFDIETEEPVFIKVKDAEVTDNDLRMEREAEALASLSHPQIPRLIDADTSEAQPFPYIVSEFKPGSIYMRTWYAKNSQPQTAAEICLSALSPLDYVHDQGIEHRDIKRDNFVINVGGLVSALVDFELALWDGQPLFLDRPQDPIRYDQIDSSRVTQTGRVKGTADYISPERAAGERGTAQSDIYSLGIMLYEFVYGQLPFVGTITEVAKMHVREPIVFPYAGGVITDDLIEIIETATQKSPEDRYASAGEMGEALERYLTDAPAMVV